MPTSFARVLKADFAFWKSLAPGSQTAVFGKDAFNSGSRYLRHVHMVPVCAPEQLAEWNAVRKHNQRRGTNRWQKSDRYAIYADGGRYGYLIIEIIDDPGAHDIWAPQYATLRRVWEQIAYDFVCLGAVP